MCLYWERMAWKTMNGLYPYVVYWLMLMLGKKAKIVNPTMNPLDKSPVFL